MNEHRTYRATIVRKGRCAEDGYTEPYAILEDGRTMPMGWNAMGPIFEVGTTGTAQYVRAPNAGLWQFTPDKEGTLTPENVDAVTEALADALRASGAGPTGISPPEEPREGVAGFDPAANPHLCTGRGPSGKLRNFKAMGDAKLRDAYVSILREGNDPEAEEAVSTELRARKLG